MSDKYLTPSAVNNYLKEILEKDKYLKFFNIKGEISNLKYHSNGNVYFSVKDDSAQINCVMFKTYESKLSFKLEDGLEVMITGSLYLYTKMGMYNINVKDIKEAGQGDLHKKYEQLKKEFELKGFFDSTHKQPIPQYPNKIGVITSKTGAAVQDIITTIKRRYPICEILIYDTLVQGTKAKDSIVSNIEKANKTNACDVLIVGRGGGSIEDLWAFNEEIVVKAIFNSSIPIVTSIGHETDTTLSDFVSDKRAPTPTAAAELVTPNIEEIQITLENYKQSIMSIIKKKIEKKYLELKLVEDNQYFRDPILNIKMNFEQLTNDYLLSKEVLKNNINSLNLELSNNFKLSRQSVLHKLESKQNTLNQRKELIDTLNPLSILSKGYSVVQQEEKVLKSINQVQINDKIDIRLNDGVLKAEVLNKEYDGK
ncbi:MAG: exodeoxyribonuclease VII large subunit [Mycoplasmatales bacterium]